MASPQTSPLPNPWKRDPVFESSFHQQLVDCDGALGKYLLDKKKTFWSGMAVVTVFRPAAPGRAQVPFEKPVLAWTFSQGFTFTLTAGTVTFSDTPSAASVKVEGLGAYLQQEIAEGRSLFMVQPQLNQPEVLQVRGLSDKWRIDAHQPDIGVGLSITAAGPPPIH